MVQDEQEKWDIVIKPRSGLFRLDLEEVWLYRDLLVMYIRRDIVTFYGLLSSHCLLPSCSCLFLAVLPVFLPTDFPNRCFIWRAYFAGIISRSV